MSFDCTDGEPCEVYNEQRRKAAKEHVCDACHETIRKGDYYNRTFILFEGDPEVTIRCLRCDLIHMHLRTLDPGVMYPMETLDCGLDYKEEWDEDPPDEIQALAFANQEQVQVAHFVTQFLVWLGGLSNVHSS